MAAQLQLQLFTVEFQLAFKKSQFSYPGILAEDGLYYYLNILRWKIKSTAY